MVTSISPSYENNIRGKKIRGKKLLQTCKKCLKVIQPSALQSWASKEGQHEATPSFD